MRNLKIGAVILLIVLTIAGLCQLLEGITIIRSTGQAVGILTPDGSIHYKCDRTTSNECTIEIKPPVQ
jgi:hypothetical protein